MLQYITYWLRRIVYRRNCECKISWFTNWLPHDLEKTILSKWFLSLVEHVMLLGRWSLSVTLTLKSIYYVFFHSIIKCGIIFGGNSSNSGKIFTLQKKIVRIMADAQPRTSFRSLFKQLDFTCCMPVYRV